MKKIFKKKGAKRVTAIALALVSLISTIFAVPLSVGAASKEVTITEVFKEALSFTLSNLYLVSDFSSELWYAMFV